MKKVCIICSLLIFSFHAFAGGQVGTGGNGCWTLETNKLTWKSIEELSHPEIIKATSFNHIKPTMPVLPTNNIKQFNLMDRFESFDPFKRFERIAYSNPHFHRLLRNLSKLFQVSYLVQVNVEGVFEGDVKKLHKKCVGFSPALMTMPDGSIVFFRPIWNRISTLSAEIMLIHETLRLAQTFHPAFDKMTNAELQLITSLFFGERNRHYLLNNLINKYESSLRDGCDIHLHGKSSDFSGKFLQTFCTEELSIDELNQWRGSDQKIPKKLRSLFFN